MQEYVHPALVHEVFDQLPFTGGYMYIDDTPGIGVDIDEQKAKQYPYQRACLPVNRKTDGTMFHW
jgi:mannonate dehydratase